MKRAVAIVGGLAVIAALIGAGWIVNVYRTHPRNESGYIAYLQTYGIDNTPTAHLPARALLITEGDRACDWLGGQTWALWRTTPQYRIGNLELRYTGEVDGRQTGWGSTPDRASITSAAWNYLCPATLELRKPHFIFSDPHPD